MNEYKQRFLLQSMLGQKTKLSVSEQVIKQCISRADQDMMSGGRFISNKFKCAKKERVEYIYKLLSNEHFVFNRDLISDVSNSCFWENDDGKEVYINGKEHPYKAYGLAQKLINMTFKYLYIYEDYTTLNADFTKCDCPLDSIIIGKLQLDNELRWTNISQEEYIIIQEKIDSILLEKKYNAMSPIIGRMAFDDNWNND